jgi:hypothetical protein
MLHQEKSGNLGFKKLIIAMNKIERYRFSLAFPTLLKVEP